MIKPPKAEVLTDGASRKKVYAYEHRKLEKYCDYVEGSMDGLKFMLEQAHNTIRGYQKDVNQYSKLSNDSDEIESIKGEL